MMITGIDDAALLRALAEDVPDMAQEIRNQLRLLADRLASPPPQSRSQKLAAAGHTRRPTWKSLPPEEDEVPQSAPQDASYGTEQYMRGFNDAKAQFAPQDAQAEKPFPAPGKWFPTTVLGSPMREYAPGKWEHAHWPSEASQSAPGEAVAVDVDAMLPVDAVFGNATFKAGSCRWRDLIALQHFMYQATTHSAPVAGIDAVIADSKRFKPSTCGAEWSAGYVSGRLDAKAVAGMTDAKDAARWREVLKTGIPYSKDLTYTDEQIAAFVDERITARAIEAALREKAGGK